MCSTTFTERCLMDAMDAQRYDLTKRRRRALSVEIHGRPLARNYTSDRSGSTSSPPSSNGSWRQFRLRFPSADSRTSSDPSDNEIDSRDISPLTSSFEVRHTDVFERHGYTTTRTIIHTSSHNSIFSLFSHSAGSSTSLSNLPCREFTSLSCLASPSALEQEVARLNAERELQRSGNSVSIEVQVDTKIMVSTSDLPPMAAQPISVTKTSAVSSPAIVSTSCVASEKSEFSSTRRENNPRDIFEREEDISTCHNSFLGLFSSSPLPKISLSRPNSPSLGFGSLNCLASKVAFDDVVAPSEKNEKSSGWSKHQPILEKVVAGPSLASESYRNLLQEIHYPSSGVKLVAT